MSARAEFDLIDWYRHRCAPHPNIRLGIGDDAAVLQPTPGEQLLVTTDMLMDGRHFRVGEVSPQLIGRKAMAVNLSDIAAMAGKPLAAFVSLALPRQGGRQLAEQIFEGMSEIAGEFAVSIAGGDTNSWDGPLVINVTLIGETVNGKTVTREGAQPGDWILVTGPLGGSIHGRQFTFIPRIHEARALANAAPIHAMLDLSDGVASDLGHILRESGVGATIHAESLPIHADVPPQLSEEQRWSHALGDGEDFELLLTVSPADGERLVKTPPLGVNLFRIGIIDSEAGCRLRTQDRVREMPPAGWVHQFD